VNRVTRPADYPSWSSDRQNAWVRENDPELARALALSGDDEGEKPHPAARPPEFSDEALALRFADRHAGDLRFVAAWSKWLISFRELMTIAEETVRADAAAAKQLAEL
jgi:hypothetical protein